MRLRGEYWGSSVPSSLALLLGGLVLLSCGGEPVATAEIASLTSGPAGAAALAASFPIAGSPFDPVVKQIVVEVDYEEGAAPTLPPSHDDSEIWPLFSNNLRALVGAHRVVRVPKTEADLQEFPDDGLDDYDGTAVLALADKLRSEPRNPDRYVFQVVFINGYWYENGARQEQVLGVNLAATGVIAVFQPANPMKDAMGRFVEQTTLIHEMGHALGLVNWQTPALSPHQDTAHGHHCNNPKCVMYYLNEGMTDVLEYVQKYAKSHSSVLFDDACLADVENRFDAR